MSMNFLTPIPEPQQIDNSDLEDIILRLEKIERMKISKRSFEHCSVR